MIDGLVFPKKINRFTSFIDEEMGSFFYNLDFLYSVDANEFMRLCLTNESIKDAILSCTLTQNSLTFTVDINSSQNFHEQFKNICQLFNFDIPDQNPEPNFDDPHSLEYPIPSSAYIASWDYAFSDQSNKDSHPSASEKDELEIGSPTNRYRLRTSHSFI